MKANEKILLQGLILSFMTQLAISLVADNASPRSPSAASSSSQGIVGSLYRSAAIKANPEKDSGLATSARGQRCVRCGQSGYYGGGGGYTDRYYDDYYYRDRPQAGGYYGREDPYQRDPYYSQNRNWYPVQDYRQPSYDSYNRYEERYYGRDDPYYAQREQQPAYDTRYNSNYNSYRGNGYDNLNPMYYDQMRDRFQRDRSYGYDQYYDRFYDRPGYRAAAGGQYYDNRNFRPYDETYSSSYGRPSLGSSYLFDRTEEDGKTGSGMSPPIAITDDKKQESANMEMKSE